MARGRVRPWSFWRREFWTRPALLMVVAAACAISVPFTLGQGYKDLRNEHRVEVGRTLRIEGELKGRHREFRARMGTEYTVLVDGEFYDNFRVRGFQDVLDPLADGPVVVRVVDGDIVAVETSEGLVPVWSLGLQGAVRALLSALVLIAAAIGLFDYARRKATEHGSWWSMEGPAVVPGTVLSGWLAGSAGAALFTMFLGVPWWLALLVFVAVLVRFGRYLRRKFWP